MHRNYVQAQHPNGPEDLSILIDVSPSMESTDYPPSRIEAAVQAVKELLALKLSTGPGDNVSIIAFSNEAEVIYPISSLSSHYIALYQSLGNIQTGLGTNITSALQTAKLEIVQGRPKKQTLLQRLFGLRPTISHIQSSSSNLKRILLLSDGAHHERECPPEPLAAELKASGVEIDVVGIGSRFHAGEFDEEQLKRIASIDRFGRPRYYWIGNRSALVAKVKELTHNQIRRLNS